ncbi:MAG TPA: YcnI family protein [Sphingomicrobium sp.]|nr:YcnI family protein [Sphingomicrobium sp.]
MLTNPFFVRGFRAAAAAAMLFTAVPVSAHVTVSPKQSTPGAWEKYEIRVPNEKQVATTALEVRFPAGLRVMSFEDKPGWTLEPLRDSKGAITGARWKGQLPPERFTEFAVIAVNPKAGGDLVWSAAQTYADGTVADWSGAAGSEKPAPRVRLKPEAR